MLLNRYKVLLIIGLFGFASPSLFSQRVGFIDSETIRQNFPEAYQAEQRIQAIVDEWKREIQSMQEQINILESEIKINHLNWSEEVSCKKSAELESLKNDKADYATDKFKLGGEFDKTVKQMMLPVESKINSWLKQDSNEEEIDMFERDE